MEHPCLRSSTTHFCHPGRTFPYGVWERDVPANFLAMFVSCPLFYWLFLFNDCGEGGVIKKFD